LNSSTEEFKIKVWQLHLKNLAFNVSSMTVLICLRERCTFRKGCCAEMFLLCLWIPFKLRMYVVMKIDYYWIAVVLKLQQLTHYEFILRFMLFEEYYQYILKKSVSRNKQNSKNVLQQKTQEVKDFYIQWLFGNFSKSISLRDISFICSLYPWK